MATQPKPAEPPKPAPPPPPKPPEPPRPAPPAHDPHPPAAKGEAAAHDPQAAKLEAEKPHPPNWPYPPVKTVGEEQIERSNEMQKEGIEKWKDEHDMRSPEERAPKQVAGVAQPPPPPQPGHKS